MSNTEVTGQVNDDSYVSKDSDAIPVVRDGTADDSTYQSASNDSDAQLERDESEAIDKSNIIDERTRGAGPTGSYAEKEEDDLPAEVADGSTGTSAGRQ